MIEKTDDIYPTKVVIENFWDDDIKIKNKRFSNEDLKRYQIKDWNVDEKINELFDKKSTKII